MQTSKIAEGVSFIFLFSTVPSAALGASSLGGKGRIAKKIPSTMMMPAARKYSVRKDISLAATKVIRNGSRNCAIEIANLVNRFAIAPFSLKISMQEGVMLVSKKEFAMPLQIIRIYAKTVLCVKVMPIKKMAKNTTPTNALNRLPYLSEKGPANGKAINRPRPTAAMIAITLLTSKLPSAS